MGEKEKKKIKKLSPLTGVEVVDVNELVVSRFAVPPLEGACMLSRCPIDTIKPPAASCTTRSTSTSGSDETIITPCFIEDI